MLRTSTIALYSLPQVNVVFMVTLINFYFLKFSTDVLGLSPATIGIILASTRLFDAVTDVAIGFLSDKTNTRLGRRRPWLLGSALPIAISFYALWAPPTSLDQSTLYLWIGVSAFLLFLALTAFVVPHIALGAELSDEYHERTKIFAGQQMATSAGMVLGLIGMFVLIGASNGRSAASSTGAISGLTVLALILVMTWKVRERESQAGQVSASSWSALTGLARNEHARLHLGVHLLASIGSSFAMVTVPYHAQYIVGDLKFTTLFALCVMIPAAITPALWLKISRRIDKKRTRIAAMLLYAISFIGVFMVQRGDVALMCSSLVVMGIAMGGGLTLGLSIQADVVDYDFSRSGEHREGLYMAAWTFLLKTAMGIASLGTGTALQAVGFRPNVAQPYRVKLMIRFLHALCPAFTNLVGALVFRRFKLRREESGPATNHQ